ncbi:MAG: hypothetical protein ACK51L_03390, partial [bacterium]
RERIPTPSIELGLTDLGHTLRVLPPVEGEQLAARVCWDHFRKCTFTVFISIFPVFFSSFFCHVLLLFWFFVV